MLATGEMLCGICWGFFQTLTLNYAADVCPIALRYYLTSFINVCWVAGQLFASGILKMCQEKHNDDDIGWRLPFALQWIWPIPIAIYVYLAPESPWFYVRKNKPAEAARSLKILLSGPAQDDAIINAMVKRMQLTVEKEREIESSTSYMECFNRENWRRTRISSILWLIQNESGTALSSYCAYFLEKAGLSDSWSFTIAVIGYAIGFLSTFLSWILSARMGHKTLYMSGLILQGLLLWAMGGCGFAASSSRGWPVAGLMLAFSFIFQLAVGPATYCIVTEIPSVRLKTKTVALARSLYNVGAIFNSVITPYMINTTAWNWGTKSGLFWGGLTTLWVIWVYFEVPETKGRTFGEIDELFYEHVPSRKFATTEVEPFDESKLLKQLDKDQITQLVRENPVNDDVEKE